MVKEHGTTKSDKNERYYALKEFTLDGVILNEFKGENKTDEVFVPFISIALTMKFPFLD